MGKGMDVLVDYGVLWIGNGLYIRVLYCGRSTRKREYHELESIVYIPDIQITGFSSLLCFL